MAAADLLLQQSQQHLHSHIALLTPARFTIAVLRSRSRSARPFSKTLIRPIGKNFYVANLSAVHPNLEQTLGGGGHFRLPKSSIMKSLSRGLRALDELLLAAALGERADIIAACTEIPLLEVVAKAIFKILDRLLIHTSRSLVSLRTLEGFPDFPLRDVKRLCPTHAAPSVTG